MNKKTLAYILFPLAAVFVLFPLVSSGISMLLGLTLALIFGNPYLDLAKKYTHKFLAFSVIGLGAGMNIEVVGKVGLDGIGYTVLGITLTMVVGTLLGKILRTEKDTSLLVTIGTAICGGSAIAAVAPVIRARHHEVSVALGIVFLLNACALFIFPIIGHHFSLEQTQFGLWSALAIHDTSSVVGATLKYGAQALEVGTTVKLARALWIIPVAMLIGVIRKNKATSGKKPWFILGFLMTAALVTWIPELRPAGHIIETVAKRLMVLTLFLIGSGLTRQTISQVGIRPFIQGILLWLIMASLSFIAIYFGWIQS